MEITFQKVEHRYQYKTPFERRALYDVDVSFPSGGYYAIIGHTGSGKSTMIQHLNGLLQPTNGTVQIGEHLISAGKKEKKLKPLRKKVGVVFQFQNINYLKKQLKRTFVLDRLILVYLKKRQNKRRKMRSSLLDWT